MNATVPEILLADAKAMLVQRLQGLQDRGQSDRALVGYLLHGCGSIATASKPVSTVDARAKNRDYQNIAALGYASAYGKLGQTERSALKDDLKWLTGRAPTASGNSMRFCTDAVALLGIALAVNAINDAATTDAVAKWMCKFIGDSYKMSGIDDWERCLFAAAGGQLGMSIKLPQPEAPSVADVRVALLSKGLLDNPDRESQDNDEVATLQLVRSVETEQVDPLRAAIMLAAMDWIRRDAPVLIPGRTTIADVCELLRRFESGLRRWTWEEKPGTSRTNAQARRWDVDNEYHVQNLLWFLLSPIFPDLSDEEYFPPLGQKQPRGDLLIPSLRLIIEVKFMRSTTSFQKIIDEIAQDASLYLADQSDYTDIVAFVWDDTRRTEEHDLLVDGLKKIKGITDAIIVSRPGRMVDGGTPSQCGTQHQSSKSAD